MAGNLKILARDIMTKFDYTFFFHLCNLKKKIISSRKPKEVRSETGMYGRTNGEGLSWPKMYIITSRTISHVQTTRRGWWGRKRFWCAYKVILCTKESITIWTFYNTSFVVTMQDLTVTSHLDWNRQMRYKTNEGLLWKRVYVDQKKPKIPRKKKPPKPFKFHLGDVVRISCSRRTFQSYYEQRWNEEVFTIKEIYTPWNSRLVDYYGGAIEWSFLQQRTSKVCKGRDDLFKMEKVKKRRKTNGIPEIYVKLLGYPKIFNNWIRESDGRHLHLILYSSERVNPSFFSRNRQLENIMKHRCNVCAKQYFRAQDLLRHKRNKNCLSREGSEIVWYQRVPQVPWKFRMCLK